MADFKPAITPEEVAALLHAELGTTVRDLRLLKGGQLSQAFGFGTAEGEFVVRFNASEAGFQRDRYAGEHFASPTLPIPRILATGQVEGTPFAISEFVPGGHLHIRPPAEYLRLLPYALDALDTLHRIAPIGGAGYGPWQESERGPFATWRAFLQTAIEEETEGFFAHWHRLFDETFLERDFYEANYHRMMELADHCPEERRIVHGDFGFDNVLTDGARVTGVLDWSMLGYGDPVWDIARIDFFSAKEAVTALLHERYAATTTHFAERMACYRCWTALGSLRFYAKANDRPAYGWTKQRIAAEFARL